MAWPKSALFRLRFYTLVAFTIMATVHVTEYVGEQTIPFTRVATMLQNNGRLARLGLGTGSLIAAHVLPSSSSAVIKSTSGTFSQAVLNTHYSNDMANAIVTMMTE